MCLLAVSMMNNHIYGSKVPQNPHFGGLSRHFKPNMRKIQIAISSDLCVRLTWNLTCCWQRLRGWSRMVVKQLQDGGRTPFWKSIYRHISANNHPISMKFCTQQQISNWMNVTWSKMKKLHWTDSEYDRTYFLLYIMLGVLHNPLGGLNKINKSLREIFRIDASTMVLGSCLLNIHVEPKM